MELEMVLNELSLRIPAEDIYTARQRMSDFIKMVATATSHGVKRTIRTHNGLDSLELASGYPIARWRNDIDVDRDTRRFFTTLITKSPFLNDVIDPGVHHSFDLSDFFLGGDRAYGLGVAFLLEALAVSIRSETCWYAHKLQLAISQIGDDGEVTDSIVEIHHASSSDHVREHMDWIKMRLQYEKQNALHNGMDIWNHKDEWFPDLYFCETVKERVSTISHGDLILGQVLKKLQELEDYCRNWLDGPFDYTKINHATPESPATLEKYGPEHTFLCHDAIPRLFSWHVRLTPDAWRLFFFPILEERRFIVGYIGPKLPTVLYRH
jgi:hypothetical protein